MLMLKPIVLAFALMLRCVTAVAHRTAARAGKPQGGPRGGRRRALVGLGAALAGWIGWPAASVQARPPAVGQKVQWPTVDLIDGTRWSGVLAEGRPVVVVFWATTCPFCKRHNAHIEKLRLAAQGGPLQILTVARDKDVQAVRRYMAQHGYGFAVTLAHGPMAAALHERRVIPLSVAVGADGRVREVVAGEMFEEDVMQWLRLG